MDMAWGRYCQWTIRADANDGVAGLIWPVRWGMGVRVSGNT